MEIVNTTLLIALKEAMVGVSNVICADASSHRLVNVLPKDE